MSQQLKVLLRKEFRRQRSLLIGGAVLTCVPYLLHFLLALPDLNRGAYVDLTAQMLSAGSLATMLSCLMVGFFAGNAVAGERPGRSVEFLESLPVVRSLDLSSRLLGAAIPALGLLLVHAAIIVALGLKLWASPTEQFSQSPPLIVGVATATLAVFGCSWLASVLVSSPAVSAAAGVIIVVLLASLGMLALSPDQAAIYHYYTRVFPIATGVLGTATLAAGSLRHLKRRVLT